MDWMTRYQMMPPPSDDGPCCRVCHEPIEDDLAYCEDHAEGYCPRCGARPEEDCKPDCGNRAPDEEV